jgi:TetR/AcrR family transcriptional regulator, transcriptional repressor for nem operon
MARNKAFEASQIIDKAKSLFQLKGFEGTSMQDLVDNLNLSRSSIYDTFGDKHQLYCLALKAYCEENAYLLAKQAESVNESLPFIKNIFSSIIEQSRQDTDKKGCYVVNAIIEFSDKNPAVKTIIDDNNKAFEKMLEKLLMKAQINNEISHDKNPKQLAKFLFTTIYGLRVSAKANSSIKDLKATSEIALSTLN